MVLSLVSASGVILIPGSHAVRPSFSGTPLRDGWLVVLPFMCSFRCGVLMLSPPRFDYFITLIRHQ
jgi:hypothetical protein